MRIRLASFALCALFVTAPLAFAALPAAGAPAPSWWGEAGFIEAIPTDQASWPEVAVDVRGNAIAVWNVQTAGVYHAWANRYVKGAGWGAARVIDVSGADPAYEPRVALDADGNAIVVWRQVNGSDSRIWATRFSTGYGWGLPRQLAPASVGNQYSQDVAVNARGDAVVAWQEWNTTHLDVWAVRYTAASGWGDPVLVEDEEVGSSWLPKGAVDSEGNVTLVFQQWDAANSILNTSAARYSVGTGWGQPEWIGTGPAGESTAGVAVDGAGNVVAVWEQDDGSHVSVWAGRFAAGVGWEGAAALRDDPLVDAVEPSVDVDAAGRAIAVWQEWDGTEANVTSRRFVPGGGWGPLEHVDLPSVDAGTPEVESDPNGNAVAVWTGPSGVFWSVWANRYEAGSGWQTPEVVEGYDTGHASPPAVAVADGGDAFVVWHQPEAGTYSVAANRMAEHFAPAITVMSPGDGFATSATSLWVRGTTEPGARVAVNGVAVSVAQDGTFELILAVAPGGEGVEVTATDEGGNTATLLVTGTVSDPLAALAGELAATQGELDEAEENLTAAQADLANASAQVATLQGDTVTLRQQLAAADVRLGEVENDLTAAQANLSATRADLAAARADLAAADTSQQEAVNSASASAGTATAVAGIGVALGAAGLAVGLLLGRRGKRPAPVTTPTDKP